MSGTHSTSPAPSGKPVKPYPDFPLFPHATGRWAKKIRGKMHYFGPWSDPDGALKKYLDQKDDLHAGCKVRPDAQALTVKELCNAFLNHKQALLDAGELSPLTWQDYKKVCDLLVSHLGKQRVVADVGPDDFASLRNRMARKWGLHRRGKMTQCVRCVFKYGFDASLTNAPVRYGPGFQRPSKKALRLHRAEQGSRLFAGSELRRLIDAAGIPMKAMLLLGINCGFGNTDCGRLPLSAVDLDAGLIDYPRPKTGIPRRCALWPETVQAIREALVKRPTPKDPANAGLVFVTQRGLTWAKDTNDCPVAKETAKLLKALGINGRSGRGFYTLRHTFRTIADEARDQPAADYIMGHEVPHMSSVYREMISDARLRAVAHHVRAWLFPLPKKDKPEAKEAATTTGVATQSPRSEE
jgi:integrase